MSVGIGKKLKVWPGLQSIMLVLPDQLATDNHSPLLPLPAHTPLLECRTTRTSNFIWRITQRFHLTRPQCAFQRVAGVRGSRWWSFLRPIGGTSPFPGPSEQWRPTTLAPATRALEQRLHPQCQPQHPPAAL